MRKILIHAPSFSGGRLFDPGARDSCLEPFVHLRHRLLALGYQLETSDDRSVEECAWVWFWDVPDTVTSGVNSSFWGRIGEWRKSRGTRERDVYRECIRAGLRHKLALFLAEPPVVLPQNWDPAMHELFPVIFTWRDDYVDGRKFLKFREAVPSQFPEVPRVPFGARKLLVNISGNKCSVHPNELYSARRETIRHFERSRLYDFDLYGVGWDDPSKIDAVYPSYRGTVKHKWEVYPYYRFGLCYENMRDVPGLVSEKIFDCMRAGCVPIFWGASNITDHVDAEAFVDRKAFKSDSELERFLEGVSEREYGRYHEAMRDYLASDRFAAFLSPAFANTIIRGLRL